MSNLEVNKGDQFIVALDISGSMQATDTKAGLSRIVYALETFKTFAAEAAKYDPDGVSLYLFGATLQAFPDLKPEDLNTKLAGVDKLIKEGLWYFSDSVYTQKWVDAVYEFIQLGDGILLPKGKTPPKEKVFYLPMLK